ncbi:MAG: hypothetical protein HY675_18420 [Chloroflexi bacterium]|nr:hypothetical protein [Chloroflexota bacterium]
MATGILQSIPWAGRRAQGRALNLSILFVVALLLVAVFSLLYLTQASWVATTGYEIKRLEDQKNQWGIKNAQLRLKLAELQSLDRIEREGRGRLKMDVPAKVIFVPVEEPAKNPGEDARAERKGGVPGEGVGPGIETRVETWLADLLSLLRP